MEHVRLIIAILLSLLVFVAWDFLFVDRQPVPPASPPSDTAGQQTSPDRTVPENRFPEKGTAAVPARTFRTIKIETGLYTAEITEKGGAFQQFVLKEYREDSSPDSPFKSLIDKTNTAGTVLVGLAGHPDERADKVFTTDYTGEVLKVRDSAESLSFYWKSEEGIVLEKKYVFYPDTYRISMSVGVINQSGQPFDSELQVAMTNPPPSESQSYSFSGPFIYVDRSLKEIAIDDIEDQNVYNGVVQWAGIEEHYFLSAIIPENPISTSVRLDINPENDLLYVTYSQPKVNISPGSRQQYDYSLFLGPKRMPILSAMGHDMEKVVDFGYFGIIAKPCLWLMNAIHDRVIANYGVAIILLTLLFKLIFWPLGNKSYKSMAEMKKLQPLMADIRKRYKDDKKKMNEEVMQLYRTYKVNPMSGCLPMVVQIPVFIAFYRMLYGAIELRHAPFMLWINDLSSPDRLFQFDLTIPFMAPPYGIPVLTIIMGATMFLQQKLSPPPGDPSQAKIMMMMPLIFTVIFINFPAGLVLYWLVNNVVSISQQYYITRKTV